MNSRVIAPTNTRKKSAVENSGQIKPLALYSFAIMMISLLAITLAREVSLIKVMTSLPMGARMRLMTCSSVTRKKIWLLVMPSTCPASVWPTGTDSIPPR